MKNLYRNLIYFFLSGLIIAVSTQCQKPENTIPELITSGVSQITSSTAISGGSITYNGGSPVIARGVCWNTSGEPVINNGRTNDGTGTGNFQSTIYGLSPSTTYFLRAYATNAEGTAYGEELMLTTAVPDTVAYDFDGNVYGFKNIGTQIWMTDNLKTTKYADGSPIATTTPTTLDISLETAPIYQWSANRDASYVPAYGRLYTGYAVESNMLCPAGWRVPTDSDWKTLSDFLGGMNVAGGKLKEAGTAHWASPNVDATNESGFSARGGGGGRTPKGIFDASGEYVTYWTSSPTDSGLWYRSLFSGHGNLLKDRSSKKMAYFVRCIKN
jgi:uncharacterized protein (TIGR02145 family)